MKAVAVFILTLLGVASAHPNGRIYELELTLALQEALAPYDPHTIASISDLNITTDHSHLLFSATNAIISGFAKVEVTEFIPPIPFLSDDVSITVKTEDLHAETADYTLTGEHSGAPFTSQGKGTMDFFALQAILDFKAESYSLDPLGACIQHGSLKLDLSVDRIDSNLEGADEINQDIDESGPALLEGLEAQINANSDVIVDAINQVMCASK